MEQISLTINDRKIICPEGTTILQVARQEGIRIPTLCDHPALEPVGACRLCLVEEEKGRLMAACVTPATSGMVISTDSPRIAKHRRNIVRLLMAEHPESCLVCSKGNRCGLRAIAAELGLGETGLYPMVASRPFEQANPYIIRDLSKCVLCGKCIRADHELVAVGAIDYNHRGFLSRPATAHELPLEASTCTFCGTCLSICPTGALSLSNDRYVGTPEHEFASVCGYCGVGCSLSLGVGGGQILEVNPGRQEDSVNGPTLCIRGHFGQDFLIADDRLQSPLIRRDGELEEASWDDALGLVSERFMAIREKYGPQSIGFLGSSKCSNEENYLFQKVARAVIGTNHVDNGAYLSGRPALMSVREKLGPHFRFGSLKKLESAEVLFVLGVDPTQSSPVVGYHLKRAALKGVPLIVVDPLQTEMSRFSSQWLALNPESDLMLLNGLAALLLKKEDVAGGLPNGFSGGFRYFRQQMASVDMEQASHVTGVGERQLAEVAEMLRGKKTVFVVGRGALQQQAPGKIMEALYNLSVVTGKAGLKENRVLFLTCENNEAGAWDMGTVPDTLPGFQPVDRSDFRKSWERAWNARLSPDPGLSFIRMILEAEKGRIKALYVMGENPVRSLPQSETVRKALRNLELLVVQDILKTETAHLAHVILPGAAFAEKGGSFTNTEGRIQGFGPAAAPPGSAKADWEILGLLMKKMGYPEVYASLDRIRGEIAELVPEYKDIVHLIPGGWVRTAILETKPREREQGDESWFFPVHVCINTIQDAAYPFRAILGSFRCHLGSGTRTSRSERIRKGEWKGEIEVSDKDSSTLGFKEGDILRVESPDGFVERAMRVEKRLPAGLIVIPKGFGGNDAMNLLPLKDRHDEGFGGWITCSARIDRVEER